MSNTLTRGVRVIVTPEYLPEQSLPDASRWLFAYHVILRNEGRQAVQLLNRHWVITMAKARRTKCAVPPATFAFQ